MHNNNNNFNNNYNNNNNNYYSYNVNKTNNQFNNNKTEVNQLDVDLKSFIGLHYFQKDLFPIEQQQQQQKVKNETIIQNLHKQLGHLSCIQYQQQQTNIQNKSQNSIASVNEKNQLQSMIDEYSEKVQNIFDSYDNNNNNNNSDNNTILHSNFTDNDINSIIDNFNLIIPNERSSNNNNNNNNSIYNSNNNNNIDLNNFNSNNNNNYNFNNNSVIINTKFIQERKQTIEKELQEKKDQERREQERKEQEKREQERKELERREQERRDKERKEQERREQERREQERKEQLQQQQQRQTNNNSYSYANNNNNNGGNNRPTTSQMIIDDDDDDNNNNNNTKNEFKSAKDQFIDNQANDKNKRNPTSSISNNSKKLAPTQPSAPSSVSTTKKRKFVPPVKQDENSEPPPPPAEEQNNNKKQQTGKSSSGKNTTTGGANGKNDETNPSGIDNINGVPLDDDKLRNLEPVMLERICNEILDRKQEVKWTDIAGLREVKEQIKEMVVYPIIRPELFKGLRIPPKGVLLFGPPGTGKTMIGKAIANQVKATFFSISASTLTSKWIGEGEKMVRCLFAVARCHLPSVIFIDEIDSLLTQRSENENEASRRIKTEFLIQWDGVAGNAEDQMLLIGATNRPEELDEAARRRMTKRLYIPLPDHESRLALLKNLLKNETHIITEDDMNTIADRSDGYSGADMKSLSTEAAYQPIRDLRGEIENVQKDSIRPICLNDFLLAIKRVKPSVAKKELDSYVDWNEKFGADY